MQNPEPFRIMLPPVPEQANYQSSNLNILAEGLKEMSIQKQFKSQMTKALYTGEAVKKLFLLDSVPFKRIYLQ